MRAPRHALADAATEQPLDEAGLAGADDDQIGLLLLGNLDDLLGRWPTTPANSTPIPAFAKNACTRSRCCC